ncbi:putative GNAT family acetyltransferase [Pullulanibacillus pueri]|uniref:Acetyltransferase n=1 Tax=Pullulanibacillus pueri TaxID=1437324 RepID=A0A8J3EKV9_9BACL|nr:GNAT family N-acetyltransferase [Pullulanibacillus pueri]MBM7681095.1 putative GNAT family acetyltransferase [Pullulanibacillus pueri]GGH77025.1 acetyltransferase [Pullulanibacillus pueri]
MNYYTSQNAEAFLNIVEPLLLENEVANTLALGILGALTHHDPGLRMEGEPYMAYVADDQGPLLILLMTPPQNLIICGSTKSLNETMILAVKNLESVDVPGFIGVKALVDPFVAAYNAYYQSTSKLEMNQRIYRLDSVKPPKNMKGQLRVATLEDLPLIKEWIHAFDMEAIGRSNHVDKRAEQSIATGATHIWEDEGKAVSMAKSSRPSKRGITVTNVYTPDAFRGKGYASNCVAALSQKLLDQGYHYCTLYTDLTNPTSNHIYQNIGYRVVTDSVAYKINKNPPIV